MGPFPMLFPLPGLLFLPPSLPGYLSLSLQGSDPGLHLRGSLPSISQTLQSYPHNRDPFLRFPPFINTCIGVSMCSVSFSNLILALMEAEAELLHP